jgi:hypothetical protein
MISKIKALLYKIKSADLRWAIAVSLTVISFVSLVSLTDAPSHPFLRAFVGIVTGAAALVIFGIANSENRGK